MTPSVTTGRRTATRTAPRTGPVDEALRGVLLAADSPAQLDAAAAVTLLDQGESNTHNTMLGKVKSVEVTHPGAPGRGMVMRDNERPHEPVVFRRGQPDNRGDKVPRRFLQVLAHVDGGKPFTLGSGRLEAAGRGQGEHARDEEQAVTVARSIVNSPLVKTAVHGADPNWGRVAMAVGKCSQYSDINQQRVVIRFGDQEVYPQRVDDSGLAELSTYMKHDSILIHVSLGTGSSDATVWGCDLTDGYVRINADYTT